MTRIATITDNRFNNNQPVHIIKAEYGDGSIALIGHTNNEVFCTYTLCLTSYGLTPNQGNVYIKDYSEGSGAINILEENGIVQRISNEPIRIGSFNSPVWEAQLLVGV